MTKSEQLVIKYAKNRNSMKKVISEISSVVRDGNNRFIEIDLDPLRESYYENNPGVWNGWVVVLEDWEACGEKPTKEEYQLARLLDQKANLRIESGHIKRSICAHGRSLIKKQGPAEPLISKSS